MAFVVVILLCLFLPQTIGIEPSPAQLIVWNVGQGSWTTIVEENHCIHYDMGGEFAPLNRLRKLCQAKINSLHLSHWDLDHYKFITRFQRFVRETCLASSPEKPSRLLVRTAIGPCKTRDPQTLVIWKNPFGKSQNERSHISANARFRTLFPGDSTRKQEALWTRFVPPSTRILLLGHHGSKTATSEKLLKSLPMLRQAIASARKQKYGHPHAKTVQRLKRFRIPMISTQDWGNLIFIAD